MTGVLETIPDTNYSGLYFRKTTVRIPIDTYSGFGRIDLHKYDTKLDTFIRNRLPKKQFTLIDIGANVGFFARQVLIAHPLCDHVICYEPDPENIKYLSHNLKPWGDRVTINEVALGPRRGIASLYRDKDNCGNYSLLPGAVTGRPHDLTNVYMMPAAEASEVWAREHDCIVLKTDVQGYDEELCTLFAPELWPKVFAGMFELWRIEKVVPRYKTFFGIIEQFPNRRFLEADTEATTDALKAYYKTRNYWTFDDLTVWR